MKQTAWVKKSQFLSLVYHDIFDYPLAVGELNRWNFSPTSQTFSNNFLIEQTTGFFHLPGRTHTTLIRKAREKTSKKKLVLARQAARILSIIPTVQFISLTGSLAMNNADEQSDIDLMIITKKKTLWITRLLVKLLSLMKSLPVRSAGRGCAQNTICLNMWLDEDNLSIPQNMQNIYTAHEVLQIVPLVDKNDTFNRFLEANEWALDYWSSAEQRLTIYDVRFKKESIIPSSIFHPLSSILQTLESLAYRFQKWYMRNRRTRELVEPGRAFFHPFDWGELIMREFERNMELFTQQKEQPVVSI